MVVADSVANEEQDAFDMDQVSANDQQQHQRNHANYQEPPPVKIKWLSTRADFVSTEFVILFSSIYEQN